MRAQVNSHTCCMCSPGVHAAVREQANEVQGAGLCILLDVPPAIPLEHRA